jgi:transcriptional regulator with XRE-family HTH domain
VKQIRREIGKYLRKIRENKKMLLDEVVAELEDLRIFCSKPNLSKIERDQIRCKTDILAGLCYIYKIKSDEVLFRGE